MRELESDMEAEARRAKDGAAQARKFERQWKESQQQADDDRRMVLELQDLLEKTQMKMTTYKRQVEELVGLHNPLTLVCLTGPISRKK